MQNKDKERRNRSEISGGLLVIGLSVCWVIGGEEDSRTRILELNFNKNWTSGNLV